MSQSRFSQAYKPFRIDCEACHTERVVNRIEYGRIMSGTSNSGWSWQRGFFCPNCTDSKEQRKHG